MKKLDYVPLINPSSAYQDGLLDAMNDRESLSPVLLAAEEGTLEDCYRVGYEAGCSLVTNEAYYPDGE